MPGAGFPAEGQRESTTVLVVEPEGRICCSLKVVVEYGHIGAADHVDRSGHWISGHRKTRSESFHEDWDESSEEQVRNLHSEVSIQYH